MKVSKYHGTGNDFVMWVDLDDRHPQTPELVAALCDRHLGVGGDGTIRVTGSDRADFFMDYWNASGETAEMCGNGIRCLAKLVYDRGLTTATEIDVDTRAGVKHLVLTVEDGVVEAVRVDMGPPAFERSALPMRGDGTFLDQPFEVEGTTYRAFGISMGNPHLVLIGDRDPREIEVRRIGPALEHHEDFPERTNVEFVRVVDGVIEVRVWERGSGETMACGTGACAALVGANLAGLAPRRSPVRFPGGVLDLEWAEDDRVFLRGPATFVFDAELSPVWVERARAGRVVAPTPEGVAT
ncbi:MAG TPA: diaminopimelate epimerase [Actinomycetota bacterium]